jgi:hypothetical protein
MEKVNKEMNDWNDIEERYQDLLLDLNNVELTEKNYKYLKECIKNIM